MAPSTPPASPVFVTALQKQQQESTRRRREQRAFNIAHGTPAASIAPLGIPKAPVTPAIHAIDPVTNEPFEQVDERLVEAAYIADPGYFVLTRHGCIYHFWHRSETFLRDQRTLFIHPNMAFKIDCRDPQRPATYAYIYTRWYFTYFMKLPWPDLVRFAREHGLTVGEQCDFLGKPGLRLCIWHAREHFEETKDRTTTEILLDELDWDAAVPYCQLLNERLYKGEDIWSGFWRAPPPKQDPKHPIWRHGRQLSAHPWTESLSQFRTHSENTNEPIFQCGWQVDTQPQDEPSPRFRPQSEESCSPTSKPRVQVDEAYRPAMSGTHGARLDSAVQLGLSDGPGLASNPRFPSLSHQAQIYRAPVAMMGSITHTTAAGGAKENQDATVTTDDKPGKGDEKWWTEAIYDCTDGEE